MKTFRMRFADFTAFTRQPRYLLPLDETPGQRTTATASLFLAEYPLFLTVSALSIGSLLLTSHLTGQDVLRLLNPSSRFPLTVLIVAGLVAPVLSETLFRFMLRLTPARLEVAVALLLLVLIDLSYKGIKAVLNEQAVFWVVPVWIVVVWQLSRCIRRPAVYTQIERFWQVNFRWVFYGLALVYALFRVDNTVSLTDWQVLWLPVLLLPGWLIGLYLGYVRMKYGFWFAVAVHALMMSLSIGLEIIRLL
ncbi:CPBP family glutamic-type intramembrane protease [Spirosoma sordidisoli]|uniref:CPBP family intramembrane metalloprotease n=1 Tax=Spirosoma sordidisoli TaxID=2502893 RepID=A0A4Q2UF67_9BACT|nr:CPBP family glutamic-type intramembrane protease [Spirosoma sordidisoli]RYC67586.1 CPBP family intramembrane metalloprotease [Spirosoma sordidisoli]